MNYEPLVSKLRSVHLVKRTVIQRLGIADRLEAIADGYSVERLNQPRRISAQTNQLGLTPQQCW